MGPGERRPSPAQSGDSSPAAACSPIGRDGTAGRRGAEIQTTTHARLRPCEPRRWRGWSQRGGEAGGREAGLLVSPDRPQGVVGPCGWFASARDGRSRYRRGLADRSQRNLQSQADAAALAGAQELLADVSTAGGLAQTYGRKNGFALPASGITITGTMRPQRLGSHGEQLLRQGCSDLFLEGLRPCHSAGARGSDGSE